jgi:ABC-2 type transport system ATP-binding protein
MDQGELIALDTPAQLVKSLQSDSALEFRVVQQEKFIDFSGIEGVKKVGKHKDVHILYSDHLQSTLTGLIQFAAEKNLQVVDLQTRTATLEDVFIHMTGRSLREA